jgi:DNA-binding transcriptional LysR family regulator
VARRVSAYAQSHAGDLRVTTSDALFLDFLMPVIADFRKANPEIRVEMIVKNQSLNLARGDSDVAFRASATPPENLFGRKIATIAWAVYGRRIDYIGRSPGLDELWRHQWTSYGNDLSHLRAFRLVEDRVSREQIVFRSDSVAAAAAAVAAGIGIGFLPCMHGDLVPSLVRISPVQPDVFDELWILTHPDIRKSGRVYAFMEHCARAILPHRDLIEGRGIRNGHVAAPDR